MLCSRALYVGADANERKGWTTERVRAWATRLPPGAGVARPVWNGLNGTTSRKGREPSVICPVNLDALDLAWRVCWPHAAPRDGRAARKEGSAKRN